MGKLIEPDDIIRAAKLNRIGGASTARILMMLLRINKINKLYSDLENVEGLEFIDRLIRELKISYEVSEEEINRIPKNGPFITISNHPYGGIDGMLMVKVLSSIRKDYRVMANFLLKKVDAIEKFILPVNPFEDRKDAHSSLAGIKDALKHLEEGNSLGIFPAGEVSSYNIHSVG
jgi:putative hemolysin